MAKATRKTRRRKAAAQAKRARRAVDEGIDREPAATAWLLMPEEAGKESFPASDPPATGLPDKPPVNADAKWKAAEKTRQRAKRGRRATV